MSVPLIIDHVVYILDDIDMLPSLSKKVAPAMSRHEQGAPASLRILVVEDNDYVRDLTLCLLEGEGREVLACKSAEEALDVFRRTGFDVVITDVSLPNMSGVELAKRVLERAPATWVIIASGYQLPTGLDKLGPHVRVMTKPFESEKMDAIFDEIRGAGVGG